MRLSRQGANIRVVYDEKHVTKEETPPSTASFIKQRTRWNQGFLQVWLKGDWLRLPKLHQRIFASYLLIWPEMQSVLIVYLFASVFITITLKLSILIVLLSYLPLYLLVIQIITLNIGLVEFTRSFNLKYEIFSPLKIILTFYPFQLLLGFSSLRALARIFFGNLSWEKTKHINAHRLKIHSGYPNLAPATSPIYHE